MKLEILKDTITKCSVKIYDDDRYLGGIIVVANALTFEVMFFKHDRLYTTIILPHLDFDTILDILYEEVFE